MSDRGYSAITSVETLSIDDTRVKTSDPSAPIAGSLINGVTASFIE